MSIEQGAHERAGIADTLFTESEKQTIFSNYDRNVFGLVLELLDEGGADVDICSRSLKFIGDRADLVVDGFGETIITGDFVKATTSIGGIAENVDQARAIRAVSTQPLRVVLEGGEVRINGKGVLKSAVQQLESPETERTSYVSWKDSGAE